MTPARLRECLRLLGLTARAAARLTGHPPNTAANWLAGRYAVPADVAAWIERQTERRASDPAPRRA